MSFSVKLIADAKAFKSEILKIVGATPAIAAKIAADAPEIEALSNLVFPGASAIEQELLGVASAVEAAVAATGTAAGANGLNVAADKGVIAAVQSVATAITSVKK